MERQALIDLLELLYSQKIDVDQAAEQLRNIPFHDLDFAKVDHHRSLRVGHPEVIFCQGKSTWQILEIVRHQISADETVFGTRADKQALDALKSEFREIEISETGRCFWRKSKNWKPKQDVKGQIVIASGGTSDAPVVEEARLSVEILGHPCIAIQDVGVAGIHRLFAHYSQLQKASVAIVVAGMEGALPSVVSGLISSPIIGVPTSIGYGANLNGMVALLAMLNSCASGLTVVNIDNGFGAACAAVRMNSLSV
jgi:hypothetical protein